MNFLFAIAIVIFPTIDTFPKVAKSDHQPAHVVKVESNCGREFYIGTGSVIRHDLVLTNHHVVEGVRTCRITFYNGVKVNAKVIKRNSVRDLALIRIPSTKAKPIELAKADPTPGTEVTIYGWAKGKEFSRLKSKVKEYYTFREKGNEMGFSVDGVTIDGMSGGPAQTNGQRLVGTLVGSEGDMDKESLLSSISGIRIFLKGFDLSQKRR
jgi:hypothetical protein